jgi:hypothetical protein
MLSIFVYVLLGTIIEDNGWIEQPSYWSMYGFFWGVIYIILYAEYNNK